MKIFHKISGLVLIFAIAFTTAFICCCEISVFASPCHEPSSSSHHCHQAVSENHSQGIQLFTLADSHKCNCEKIVANRSTPKLDISISNNSQLLQKSFTIAKSVSPVLTSFTFCTLHGPPVSESSSIPLYLQFSNLRI